MRKEEVKNYTITTDGPSGLEFELHLMPQFFNSAVCLEQSHTHTYYQIIWFRRGYGIHQVDFVDYPVDDNTLFFIAPGQVHSFHGSRDCEGVIIRFNASFMADEQSSESIFLKYDIFNAYDSLPYYKITDAESDHLYILVQAMRIELSLKSAFAHKDYMQYLVRLFLIRVQRAGTRRAVQKLSVSCVAHRSFVRFRQLLEKHFREIHTVKEYAEMLHVLDPYALPLCRPKRPPHAPAGHQRPRRPRSQTPVAAFHAQYQGDRLSVGLRGSLLFRQVFQAYDGPNAQGV